MEKIKNFLSPGHQKDDETLYGTKSDATPDSNSALKPENQSLSSHAGPTSTLENATAGTLPTSADPDTQYSRDATAAEGAGATGLGSEHYNSSGIPASNTEIYGSALTHSSQKNEPTTALDASGLSSVTPATNSAYPDSLSTAPRSTNPDAVLSSVTPATNSAYPGSLSTAESSINPIGSPEHDSHFGRDAALAGGAGATGLGAYEASKHHGHTSSTPATKPTGSDEYGSAKILGTTTTGSTVRSDAGVPGSASTSSTSATINDSHLGRNAALAGGAGVAGLSATEAKKHHDMSSTSQPIHQSTLQHLGPGAALGTASRDVLSGSGISSSTISSRPDITSLASNASIKSGVLGKVPTSEMSKSLADLPAVPASGRNSMGGSPTTSAYPLQTAPVSLSAERAFPLTGGQTSGSANQSSTSRLGRDAAVVGGAGLAGAGASEAWKRHDNSGATTSAINAASIVAPGHQARPGAWPAVTDNDAREEPAEWKDHNHGGIGHDFNGDPCGPNENNTSSGSGLPPQGPHQTQAANLLDPSVRHDSISHMPGTFPRSDSDMTAPSHGGIHTGTDSDPVRRADNIIGSHDTSSSDRHLGRDAAVAGGVGAAGLGAYEAAKKHDKPISGFGTGSSSATGPTAAGGPFSSSTTTNPRATGGPYSSSTVKGPNTSLAAADSKSHGENDSHTGRNVALGGGAAAAGLSGHVAQTHHEPQQSVIPPSTTALSSLPAHSTTTSRTGVPFSSSTAISSTGETAARLSDDHDSHTGRNVALGSGAAAAGLGGSDAYKHHDNRGVGSETQPPTTAGTSTSARAPGLTGTAPGEGIGGSEPAKHDDKNYYGRDSAAVGGIGAAGLGAHEARKHHDSEPSGRNLSKKAEYSLDERAAIAAADSRQRGIDSGSSKPDEKSHHGRDAALVGGAGVAGLGGYEAYKHHDQKENLGQTPAGTTVRNDGVPVSGQHSTLTHNQKQHTPLTSTTTDDKHHTGRDAAAVGAAGAAGAGAHHEYSKHEAEKAAKEQHKAEEKLAKEREHEAAKRHKEHEKEIKHHEKEATKHEKEAEKEKKPSLISRLLHRKKDKHGNEVDSDEEDTKHGHGKETSLSAGTVGAAGVTIAEHDGHNKLHKDPPVGHPAHDANARSSRTYFSTAAGNTLEQRAEAEVAESSTAGARTHIPAEGLSTTQGTHGNSQREGIMTDPHTGLPMNVGKYGDGHGGTDGNAAIHGADIHSGAASDAKTADWEAIKKANTPY